MAMNIREQKSTVEEEGPQMPQEIVTVKQQSVPIAVVLPAPAPTGAAGKRRTQKNTLFIQR